MRMTISKVRMMAGLLLGLGMGLEGRALAQGGPNDSQIQADVQKALDNKRFKDVKSSVSNGIVTLTGTVEVYSEKEEADKKSHHRKNVKASRTRLKLPGRWSRMRRCGTSWRRSWRTIVSDMGRRRSMR